jgi:hypothetical protein
VERDTTIDLEALGVQSHNLETMDAPFLEEGVWATIKHLPSDKASGPDGFTGRFFKYCWPIIKVDIMAAISYIWAQKFRNLRSLNLAFITLIHSFAELVTKVLANWLAGWLQRMVSPNQSAFIKKRFIQDNFMLVQQTARLLHQQK